MNTVLAALYRLRRTNAMIIGLMAFVVLSSCTQNSSGPGSTEPSVEFSAELTRTNVSSAASKSDAAVQAVSAMQISRVRILVKRAKTQTRQR